MTNPNEDTLLITSIAGAVSKSVFYICITVMVGLLLSNCNLDEAVITQCKTSCSDIGTRMESVTRSKCVCTQYTNDIKSDIWVLP